MSGNKKARAKRVPLGAPRLRLAVEEKPGFKRRWINDKDGRVSMAIEGGYSLVARDDAEFKDEDTANRNDSLNNAVSKVVNADGTKAYLMEISAPMYVSDQLAKHRSINETENALRGGADEPGQNAGARGRYIPEGGISIEKG